MAKWYRHGKVVAERPTSAQLPAKHFSGPYSLPTDKMVVCMAFYWRDFQNAIRLLEWAEELHGMTRFEVVLHTDDRTPITQVKEAAERVFREVHLSFYDYRALGWPAANNHVWREAVSYMELHHPNAPWLFWETDGVPLVPRWLDAIEDAYRRGRKPFAGHIVRGDGPVNYHMNGLGVYPPNVRDYTLRAFTVDQWAELWAWDVAMREETARHTADISHLIGHVWHMDEFGAPTNAVAGRLPTFRTEADVERLARPPMVLFHRNKDLTLIDRLRERKEARRVV